MSSQQISPFKLLWERRYPIGYWRNHLEKINPYNEHDRLEALYSLVQLTDIYAHVFAAYARNPDLPWFFIKEKTFRGDIDGVLDELRREGIATVGTMSEDPEGLVKIETQEEYDVEGVDAVAGALLGCPVSLNEDDQTIEFDESPDLHRGVSNAILDFAENHRVLLNDFKHGFRVLPVTPEDVETILGSSMLLEEEDEQEFEAQLDDLRERLQEAAWGFCFARMDTKSRDYGYDIQLDVYKVDARSCYKFAELTLDALQNLITPGPGLFLEDALAEIPELAIEGEQTIMTHEFGLETPLRDEPDKVVAEEEFRAE